MANTRYPSLWARILANCKVVDRCWIWQGQRDSKGKYPQISMRINGKHKTVRVHRLVASIVLGRDLDPVEETIEHLCDTTLCICPNCIGLMTNVDNSASMQNKRAGRECALPVTLLVPEGRYWHPDEPIPF